VTVWDAGTGKEVLALRVQEARIFGASFSSDGSRIAVASTTGSAWIRDASSGEEILALRGHTAEVNAGVLRPRWLDARHGVRRRDGPGLDVSPGPAPLVLKGTARRSRASPGAPTAARLATSSYDRTQGSGRPRRHRPPDDRWTLRPGLLCGFRPRRADRHHFGGHDVEGLDVESGAEVLVAPRPVTGLRCASFSPDGARIAVGSPAYTPPSWMPRAVRNWSRSGATGASYRGSSSARWEARPHCEPRRNGQGLGRRDGQGPPRPRGPRGQLHCASFRPTGSAS